MNSGIYPTSTCCPEGCDCCQGRTLATPVPIDNRPGLSAIAYRIGTHGRFLESMMARLSGGTYPALKRLTTRNNTDFSIALLDGWATVADVLSFYQERIANESYLRTAVERRSVLELARLIGYELSPGVAANAYVAFTLEDREGSPKQITIEEGTKVQSIPGPDELPQTFETVEEIEARGAWNAMLPRLARTQKVTILTQSVLLRGQGLNLKPGDTLLLITSGGSRLVKKIVAVHTDAASDTTQVDFVITPSAPPAFSTPVLPDGEIVRMPLELDADVIEDDILNRSWTQENLAAFAAVQGWDMEELEKNVVEQTEDLIEHGEGEVHAFRLRAAPFGHNAQNWNALPASQRFSERVATYKNDGSFDKYILTTPAFSTSWEGRTVASDAGIVRRLDLDNQYQGISEDSWIVLSGPTLQRSYKVDDVADIARSDYAISAKVTRLTLHESTSLSSFALRTTAVLAASESLSLASLPILDDVQGLSVPLDRIYTGLKIGGMVIVTGERSDLPGVIASETMELEEVTVNGGFTTLKFTGALKHSYLRETVTINANVALATHGESRSEILGSGDARQAFQAFALRQPPLTYVTASTPSGTASTLEIFVNDVRWTEVPTLYGHGPDERIYTVRHEDDGSVIVRFGDGRTGSRLPTGQENVRAVYRQGIGLGGLVKARQLSQLMSRPLGLKDAVNPQAASGAEDPEHLEDARTNAPLTIMTLDRIVSLQDYEDFARAFAGVAKALATWTWDGEKRGVHVTVAGPNGATIDEASKTYTDLLNAMRNAGDPHVPLRLASYTSVYFRMEGTVIIEADRLPDVVAPAIELALRSAFSFSSRRFGQSVTLGEVLATIHAVPGVIAADIDYLYVADQPPSLNATLTAALPQAGDDMTVSAAELLTLDPGILNLEVKQ